MSSRVHLWAQQWLACVERNEKLLLALFSLVYFPLFWIIAARTPLWNDEIFTRYISSYKSIGELLATLRVAADQQPPLYYMLTNSSISLFGDANVALRLPSIVGVWIACLSAYFFLRPRTGPAPAWCGMAVLLASDASRYATEARPYALVLGVTGILLLAWQAAAAGTQRRWTLPLTALCVFLLGSVHYLAVLLLLPFAIAEFFRWLHTRRFDYSMTAAFATGAAALLVYLPLLLEVRAFASVFWNRPSLSGAVFMAHGCMSSPFLVAALFPAALIFLLAARIPAPDCPDPLPAHEACLAGAFVLMPFILPPAIVTLTGGFVGRYVLGLLAGCALGAGWAVSRLTRGQPMALFATLILFVSIGAMRMVDEGRMAEDRSRRGQIEAVRLLLKANADRARVAIDSPLLFLEFWHHATSAERARIHYPASAAGALHHLGTDSPEQSLIRLARTFPLAVLPATELNEKGEFLLLHSSRRYAWLLRALIDSGATLLIRKEVGEMQLILVKMNRPLALR